MLKNVPFFGLWGRFLSAALAGGLTEVVCPLTEDSGTSSAGFIPPLTDCPWVIVPHYPLLLHFFPPPTSRASAMFRRRYAFAFAALIVNQRNSTCLAGFPSGNHPPTLYRIFR